MTSMFVVGLVEVALGLLIFVRTPSPYRYGGVGLVIGGSLTLALVAAVFRSVTA